MMRDKGSITVYLALMMSVLLSMLAAGLHSLEIAQARLEMVSAADLGLYSLFGQYDSELLEQYHLLFVDGADEQGALQLGRIYERFTAGVSANCRKTAVTGGSIRGYTLATDGDGVVFKEQVVEYMEKTLGAHGVQMLLEQSNKADQITALQEQSSTGSNSDEAIRDYERITAADDPPDNPGNEAQTEVPEDFVNPIETIGKLKQSGILSLVLPQNAVVSDKQTDIAKMLSNRQRQQGMGEVPTGNRSTSLSGKLLFQEYIIKFCSNYTTADVTADLSYQAEYILQGKDNDMANLKGVVNRLLLMREGANLLHLLTDPGKQSQLSAAALMIAAALCVPQAQPLIEKILMLCWAYGESILDVRELLGGGKVVLVKDVNSWQLSLENLSQLAKGLDHFGKSSEQGLDYQSYLRILLALNKDKNNVMRCMDIVEQNISSKKEHNNFRLDSCIAAVKAEIEMSISGQQFSIIRSYGYDM